ncbi:MAG: hypothetical protein HOP32_10315 [Nitrospira sp.]|nr:hypothetical protein [Nitrospira sp.]
MAWGSDVHTEEELEKLAAVRGYFQGYFPGASVRDSYDAARAAQVFLIEPTAGEQRNAVVSIDFLQEYVSEKMEKALISLRVAEHLQSAKGREVLLSSWGVEEKEE